MSNLILVRNPFNHAERDYKVIESGQTIEALVGEYIPAGVSDIVVSVNGQVVPKEEWSGRVIDASQQLVVMPRVLDDDGGLIGTLLAIGLSIVAPYIAGYILTGQWAVVAGFQAAMLSAGIGLIGSMLVGAIFKPERPAVDNQSFDASQAYSWSPVTTQEPGKPLVRAYGSVKLYGNIIGGYIKNTGDTGKNQVAYVLIDLGVGPYSALSDFKINNQAIADYHDVALEYRLGNLNQTLLPDFDDTYATSTIGTKVVQNSPITRTTVGSNYDALEVVIVFPQGIYYSNDSGGLSELEIEYGIEISPDDGVTWQPITFRHVTRQESVWGWRWAFYVQSVDANYIEYFGYYVWVVGELGSTVRTDHYDAQWEYRTIGGVIQYGYWGWSHINWVNVINETIPTTIAKYGQSQPVRITHRAGPLNRGTQYKVRVTNYTVDQTSSRYADDMYLDSIIEVLYDDFTYPRTALVGIKALATEQLSGGFSFECLADAALIRVWDGSTWSTKFSRNPAWITWDILTQPVLDNDLNVVRYDGYNPSRLILADFYAWAQWCDDLVPDGLGGTEPRCLCDIIFDTTTSMWDAALEVASNARAILALRGTSITVIFDRRRTAPAQLFSVGNTIATTFTQTYLPITERAQSIEIDYINQDTGHQKDKIAIVNPNVDESGAQRVQVALRGVRRPTQIWREGQLRLARNEYIKTSGNLQVDIDSIACQVGDMVWLQDDVTEWGSGGRTTAGSTTTSVNLDKPFVIESGKAYELVLRHSDDTISISRITTGAGTVSTVDLGTPLSSAPDTYTPYSIGEVGSSIKEFLVVDIQRNSDQQATLSLIEYVDYYGRDEEAPVIPSLIVPSTQRASISNLTLTEGMNVASDGTINVYVDVEFSMTAARAGRIYVNSAVTVDSPTGSYRINGVTSGATLAVGVRPVDYLGNLGTDGSEVVESITVVGKLANPSDILWLNYFDDTLTWGAVPDIDLLGYKFRAVAGTVADWERGYDLHEGLLPLIPKWSPTELPRYEATIMAKAVDTSKLESANPAAVTINLGDPVVDNVIDTLDLKAAVFPGVSSGTLSGGNLVAVLGGLMWNPNPTVPMWSANESDPMWDLDYYDPLFYVATVTHSGARVGAQMTINSTIVGEAVYISYRRYDGDSAPMWGSEETPMFSGYDEAPMWPRMNAPGFVPWPGAIVAQAGDWQIKVQTTFSRTQGQINALEVSWDVPDREEHVHDVAISSGGTRLALAGSYTGIKAVHLTLQDDAGTARTARVMDKNASLGPLIQCFDSSGTGVAGHVDAFIQGY